MSFLSKLWQKRFYFFLLIFCVINFISLGYRVLLLETLSVFFLFILLYKYLPKIFNLGILVYGILGAFLFPASYYYGTFQLAMVAAIMETNPSEAGEFLATIPWYLYLYAVLFFFYTFFVISQGRKHRQALKQVSQRITYRRKNPLTKVIGILLALAVIVYGLIHKPLGVAKELARDGTINQVRELPQSKAFILVENSRVYPLVYPFKVFYAFKLYFEQKNKLEQGLTKESSWQVLDVNPHYKNYIVIVGESVRQDFMQVYGAPFANTPYLNKAPAKFYHGYLSASQATYTSLLYTLYRFEPTTEQVYSEDNILSLAKKAGFTSYWFSNQGYSGKFDSLATKLALQADKSHFLTFNGFERIRSQDNALLPIIQRALNDQNTQPRLIVVHMIGSHPVFCRRIWDGVEFDYVNKELSCYVETIKQTDSFIEQIVQMAQATGESYSLMYFSDHGLAYSHTEDANEMTLIHSPDFKQSYQVPFFVISSDNQEQEHINFQQSATNFLQGFAEWTGITLGQYQGYPSFWLGTEQPLKVFAGDKWVEFNSLKEQKFIPAK
ncbi:hypothetical protein CKF54_07760 [Psittacicella hinzii]|uniref:Sulfatase N-terminal domain-containing protein n=1 Tax=Psittacicella hinzii TaxID=2028575 RepID=A0A3A1Y1C2_9GAMM|nr:phosphoethanolamine transferase [Psittacicella hinzii]RIY31089.1 hypothetical protein CKF54_07760 [Psittacicella hinzii]